METRSENSFEDIDTELVDLLIRQIMNSPSPISSFSHDPASDDRKNDSDDLEVLPMYPGNDTASGGGSSVGTQVYVA